MHRIPIDETIVQAVLSEVLGEKLFHKYENGNLSKSELKPFCDKIVQLSEAFNTKNEELGKYLSNPEYLKSYSLYYMFPNIAKLSSLFSYLIKRNNLIESGKSYKVLEVGSGPGSGLLGFLNGVIYHNLLKSCSFDLTPLDFSRESVRMAEKILSKIEGGNISVMPEPFDITEKIPEENFDIIIMANVINELFRDDEEKTSKRAQLLNDIKKNMREAGVVVIIEPSLKKTSRELIELRNLLIKEKILYPVLPCTHTNFCPLSTPEHEDGWCHESYFWDAPAIIDQVDEITGFNKHHVKFSYLVLKKVREKNNSDKYYSLTSQHDAKGFSELMACGENGCERFIYSHKKSKGEHSRVFKKIEKGDIFILKKGSSEGNPSRIYPDDYIEILD